MLKYRDRIVLWNSHGSGSHSFTVKNSTSEVESQLPPVVVEPPWPPEVVLPVILRVDTTWDSPPLTVAINFAGGMARVDFGDGSEVKEYNDVAEHTYVDLDTVFDISVTPLSRIETLSTDVMELTDWGSAGSVNNFRFLHMAPTVPASLPNWLKDASYMFYGCSGFNTDVSEWDVSNITTMEYMFFQCSSLNSDLSTWVVGNVTNMRYMFSECYGNLGTFENWNTAKVTDFSHMFHDAGAASNLNPASWSTSNATNMSHMFAGNNSGHGFNADLSMWDTSKVTDMSGMFDSCHSLFNENNPVGYWSLEKWNTGQVTNMSRMFYHCYYGVSSNISNWNTSNVTDMSFMFAGCQNMNHLTHWDVGKVTTMESMFEDAFQFNSDLSRWNVSNVTNMDCMFKGVQWIVTSLDKWCVEKISVEPTDFINDADYMDDENKPVWGTCPTRQ